MNSSNADFVILGGDFNMDPTDKETSYSSLKAAMVSSMLYCTILYYTVLYRSAPWRSSSWT